MFVGGLGHFAVAEPLESCHTHVSFLEDSLGDSERTACLHLTRTVGLPKCATESCLTKLVPSCLQIEMLSPYEAVAERFKEQYKTFATALDTTRHELPVKSIHLDGDGQQFLGRKQGGSWTGSGSSEWPMRVGTPCVPATFIRLCRVTRMAHPSSDGRGHGGRQSWGLSRVVPQVRTVLGFEPGSVERASNSQPC